MPPISSEPIVLEVHPDTGHHFFTLPLSELIWQKEHQKDLPLYAQWGPRIFTPWGQSYPWLRYRFELHDNKPFITIAVETNLGNHARGTLYKVEPCEPVPDVPLFAPYAKEHIDKPSEDKLESITPVFTFAYARKNDRGEVTTVPVECEVDLKIKFLARTGTPVPVDLIVDLGNSRTAAVLLEAPGAGGGSAFNNRLQVLKIGQRGTDPAVAQARENARHGVGEEFHNLALIDSWFLLHESLFAHLEPGSPAPDGQEPEHVIRKASESISEATGEKRSYMEYLLPHSFIELSPVMIGGGKSSEGAAKIFANQQLGLDYPFFLSSPKRYVWSQSRRGVAKGTAFWFQIPNKKETSRFVGLRGLIRYFMDTDGRDLNTDSDLRIQPPSDPSRFQTFIHDSPPTYSASDSVCWFALAMIEAAYRQINSKAYLARTQKGSNTLRRRLRHIRVTCPSGWTFEERDLYFSQWRRAINLFTMARFQNWDPMPDGDKNGVEAGQPVLCTENLDEAVCSQLPIFYSEIQSFDGAARKWIELYGDGSRITVMNLDIGGGTTDVAVINYSIEDKLQHKLDTRLIPALKFRDGYPVAGDMVVKRIIEQILIPAWFEQSARSNPILNQCRSELELLFRQPRNTRISRLGERASSAPKCIARAIRLLFMPLANHLLNTLSKPEAGTENARRATPAASETSLNIQECIERGTITLEVLNDVNLLCAEVIKAVHRDGESDEQDCAFSTTAVLKCDLRAIEKCIDEVFAPLLSGLTSLLPTHSPHLLIVSGKPSELRRVKALIRERFPILPQRIIFVKDYPAGHWYPTDFATKDGKITDAKTATVVGAALYQDFRQNGVGNLSLILDNTQDFDKPAYWGLLPRQGRSETGFDKVIITPSASMPKFTASEDPSRKEILCKDKPLILNLAITHRIGRRIVDDPHVHPAPVYLLRWERQGQSGIGTVVEAEILFRWVSVLGKGDKLEIADVKTLDGGPLILRDEVKLELNTLSTDSDGEDSEFWLDDPRLLVSLPPPAGKPGGKA